MIKVTINNSTSVIEGLSIAQFKEIKDILSYSTNPQMNYYTKSFHSEKRYLIDKKGTFSTGLVYLVHNYFKFNRIRIEYNDIRVRPKSKDGMFNLNLTYTPYPEQIAIADAAERYHRGIVSACTGFGKSIAMALVINKLQIKTLIVVPNVNLKQQLRENFTSYFGNLDNITIENIDSPKLKTLTDYDCIIIDEAHHVAASTYRKLSKTAWKSIYYRFFFTATPFRSRSEENILFESIAGKVIYQLAYQTAVDADYIVPMEAYYYELPKRKKVKGHTWSQVYNELVVNNDDRNRLIANLLVSLWNSSISTLCLVKELRHGDNLKELTDGFFANGENEETPWLIRLFNEGKCKTLIGTTGVLGEGVDTRPAEFIIIAGLGKSKNQLMQQVGRGFRKYPNKQSCKIILFKDTSHKFTRDHFKEQCKILLDQYNVVPVKLEQEI